jgi:hypothetical protein
MSVSVFHGKRKRKDITNPVDWFFLMAPSDSVFPLPFPPGSFTCGCFNLRRWMKYHSCLKYFSSSSLSALMSPGHCFCSIVFTWMSLHTDGRVTQITCTSLSRSPQKNVLMSVLVTDWLIDWLYFQQIHIHVSLHKDCKMYILTSATFH